MAKSGGKIPKFPQNTKFKIIKWTVFAAPYRAFVAN